MSKKRELFIDGDVLVYYAGFAAQKTLYTYRDLEFKDAKAAEEYCKANELNYRELRKDGSISSHVEVLPEGAARNTLRMKLDSIMAACGSDKATVLLSGKNNYRNEVAVTKGYKANRENVPKPQHFNFVRALLLKWGAEEVDGIEADDAMGIGLTDDPEAVICTIDKDLNQIPGRHYNWETGSKYQVSATDAHRWFLRQLLTGDSTDNIPGIPGLGEKKANTILESVRTDVKGMWAAVCGEYAKGPFEFKDGTKTGKVNDYLNEQGRLLWIQRKADEVWTHQYYESEYVA